MQFEPIISKPNDMLQFIQRSLALVPAAFALFPLAATFMLLVFLLVFHFCK